MADTKVGVGRSSTGGTQLGKADKLSWNSVRGVALIAGVIGILLTVSVPFMPVRVDSATLAWPQVGSSGSIEAPLISYAPTAFDATVPCAEIAGLRERGGTVVATAPVGAADAERYGLVARVRAASADSTARLDVTLRNRSMLSIPTDQLTGTNCGVTINVNSTTAAVAVSGAPGAPPPTVVAGDFRPQLVGIFTDLPAASSGARITAELDTRFSSTPSLLKLAAILIGVLATAVALFALHRLDRLDGRRSRRFLPRRWWKFTVVDAVVIGTLVVWHFIGATTADDGYQFGMARTSVGAGYMANYFRYFGAPETPFGTPYYDLFALLANVSTASPWVRLPALMAGVLAWLVISREVAPRLGVAVQRNKVAILTGGLVFLAFWLPYNNGLRPEPVVALGVLLTWCSVERAIATRRMLPIAVAILVAALTLTAGPSGVICFAALLSGIRPLTKIIIRRARTAGLLALLAPLVSAGTVVLVVAFGDQTIAGMREMQRVHKAAGPDVAWFDEYLRYQYLFNTSVDGSLARKFAVFIMILGLVVCAFVMLRKGGRIPTTATGPSQRILGVTFGAMLLMMFTPTKWTHHFGVYAGLAGCVAVLTAVAVGHNVMRSPRNRALFGAMVVFVLAMAFSSTNGWWFVSSYGIPWWDKPPSIHGVAFNKLLLAGAAGLLALAAWHHVQDPQPGAVFKNRYVRKMWTIPPLTVAAAAVVAFEVLSFGKAAITQYPAYSLARSNIDAVLGQPCGLANDVLVESDPNESILRPLGGDSLTTLAGVGAGFSPNGVAADLSADKETSTAGTANSVDTKNSVSTSSNTAGTGGAALPFGLDPATTPVLGSFRNGDQVPADLTTGWYRLPESSSGFGRGGLVSIAAAGRIRSVDADGVVTDGPPLEVEYGATDSDATARPLGRITPIDIGPAPSWRNLRVPLDQIPVEADVIRLVAADHNLDWKQWLAVTPPRVPQTQTLNHVVGSTDPVLLDWAVGLAFPCQRPFGHHDGIAETPTYRILPDRTGAVSTTLWEDHFGGGPLGWTSMLLRARTVPTYLDGDWRRDWGELEQFSRIDPNASPAVADVTVTERSGTWTPGPINTSY